MSDVDSINDRHGEETWHLRQLWQSAKNSGYSVKLEDDRIWLTPSAHGSAAPGRSFPDTRAGIQAARAWLVAPVKQTMEQPVEAQPTVQQRVAGRAARGTGAVIGYIIGFVVVSGIIGGIVSWWNDNHWSSNSENTFLTSCEAQGPGVAYCECALHQVEQQYSPKEADSLSGNSAVVNQIAGYCTGQ